MVVLVGALLIWFAPRAYAAMKTALQQRPLPAAGWGIVAIIGFVVLLIVVLIAMILLAIAFGLLGFSDLVGIDILGGIVAILGASLVFAVVAGYVADALVGVALASLVMRGENPSRWRELAVLAVGAAVVVLLSSLPIVGPWVKLVVILLGLGAVLIAWMATSANGHRRAPGGWVQPPADTADTRHLSAGLGVSVRGRALEAIKPMREGPDGSGSRRARSRPDRQRARALTRALTRQTTMPGRPFAVRRCYARTTR